MRIAAKLTTAAVVIIATVACKSATVGNEGNFRFEYFADDDFLNFNKPIAVGASLDLTITQVGSNAPVVLTDAEAADPGLLEASLPGDNVVTVTALAEGNTEFTVKGAVDGGEAEQDSVNMRAVIPDQHRLWHTCQNFNGVDATDYAYLAGQPVYVPFEFLSEQNGGTEPVIGYGYYPVSFDGPGALDETHQGSQYMRVDTTDAGLLTLTSDLDGTILDMNVVEPADIDGVLQPIAFVLEDIDVGDVNPFYVLPSAAGMPVCQADVTFQVESLTPSICDVRLADSIAGDSTGQGKEFGWFEIEGVAEGLCEYSVRYPDGADGAGTTESFSYEIQP